MKTVLLPFYDDEVSANTFALTMRIVRPMGAYLEGLFVLRRPPIAVDDMGDLNVSNFDRFNEECKRIANRSRLCFERCAAGQGLAIEAVSASQSVATGWREIEGIEGQVLGGHGRLFDLIVVGRNMGRGWLNWREMVESALFESGKPVLLAPEKACTSCGEHVLIAWNSSTETARTISFAMPLLRRARVVTIATVKGWGVAGPTGEELATYLRRSGVPANARIVDPNGRTPGATILDECAQSAADLLLKGAYTQSRLRQMIFGGATRHILAQANLPVLFAN